MTIPQIDGSGETEDRDWFMANPSCTFRIRRAFEREGPFPFSSSDLNAYWAMQRNAAGWFRVPFGYTGSLPEDCRDELAKRVFGAAWIGDYAAMPAALKQIKHEEAARVRIAEKRAARKK